jgi:hypothetical protein
MSFAEPSEFRVTDQYIRGRDLVLSSETVSDDRLRCQFYWRLLSWNDLPANGLELIVSVQTGLLDSNPASDVQSQLDADEVLKWRANRWEPVSWSTSPEDPPIGQAVGLLLFRLHGVPFSYLEMVHPADHYRSGVSRIGGSAHQMRSHFELFPEHLEKGVIRRARLRGCLLPRDRDTATAEILHREFAASAPPLTT